MKKLMICVLTVLMLCGVSCAEELLSSTLGQMRVAVTEGEAGYYALELTWADHPTARYARLIPERVSLDALSFELTVDSLLPNMRLYIERGEERDYFGFSFVNGTWICSSSWFTAAGERYSVSNYRIGSNEAHMLIHRTGNNHELSVEPVAFDTQPDTMTLDAFKETAVTLKREEEARQEREMLGMLAKSFPGEDFSGARMVDHALRANKDAERMAYVIAVAQGGRTEIYLVNNWPDAPQHVRFAGLDLGDIQKTYFTMPDSHDVHDGDHTGGVSFDLGNGRYSFSLIAERDGSIQIGSCSFEEHFDDEYEYLRVTFSDPYYIVYPGHMMNRLEDLLLEEWADMRDPEVFDLMGAFAMAQQVIRDHASGEAPIIPANSESEYDFPQHVEGAKLKQGKHAVYSGPGKSYYREARGKASVSANDWVQVFGREGDWALIQYRVSGAKLRFGYVHKSDVQSFAALPELRFEAVEVCQDNGFVTSDPLGEAAWIELTGRPYDMTRLCRLGKYWMYVELKLPNGKTARMFAEVIPSHG